MTKTISWSSLSRRNFLQAGAGAAGLAMLASGAAAQRSGSPQAAPAALPPAFAGLKPLGERVRPITAEEYRGRMEHARRLMGEPRALEQDSAERPAQKLDAIFVGPGSSLYYYTGIRWGLSERLMAMILPRTGEPFLVCPEFEEGRLREQLKFPMDIRVWPEDKSPTQLIAATLAEKGMGGGRMGVEETLPFTFYEHLRQAAPHFEFFPADPVTIGCRAKKSENELALMRLACEATFDVFRATFASLREGMSQEEIGGLIEGGFAKMGLHGGALVLIGASAALPHGSVKPGRLREGDVILIDGGTQVEHYQSDVTRTGVLGKPEEKVLKAYTAVREAQDAALRAAQAGRLSGSVDGAARSVILTAGYLPGYKFFTHRVGHGIGLDGHEHPYLVKGSKTVLEPGMTFSNEPGIYVPGEFGMRCEDDMVIMPEGPAKLLTPGFAVSLEKPLG